MGVAAGSTPEGLHADDGVDDGADNGASEGQQAGVRPNNWGYCDYVDQVFRMRCFTELVRLGVFTSAKDVSESMAALQAVRRHASPATRPHAPTRSTLARGTSDGTSDKASGGTGDSDHTLDASQEASVDAAAGAAVVGGGAAGAAGAGGGGFDRVVPGGENGEGRGDTGDTGDSNSTSLYSEEGSKGGSKGGEDGAGNVVCLCIGDGCTPRTAVLAAFTTKWDLIVSIDPALRDDWRGDAPCGVERVVGFQGTLDEFMGEGMGETGEGEKGNEGGNMEDNDSQCREESTSGSTSGSPVTPVTPVTHLVLLCVHSHARLIGRSSMDNIRSRYGYPPTTLVALPCCARVRPRRDVGRPPDVAFEDHCVFSAKRLVEVFQF